MLTVLIVAAAALVWRALDLQLHQKTFLQNQGDARHLRVVPLPSHRGSVVDRNGDPLAVSTPVDSVWVNPKELAASRDTWPALTAALEWDDDRLHRTIAGRIQREFVYLQRHARPALAARVTELKVPGVYLQREYRRYYPAGEVVGHVVGFTDVDDHGQEGLELAYDEWLSGEDGSKRVLRDRYGRVVEDIESIRTPQHGHDLQVTVDRRIQYLAYRALKAAVQHHGAKSGSVVVLDPSTGDVLAMVNQPAYNPNNRADRESQSYRNRAVTDVFEPGSTIKPFIVAAALESGRFRPDSPVDTTPGLLRVRNHTVHDLRNYGRIDVATVIKKSSNVGASKLALALAPQEVWALLNRAGFGTATGVGYPGESDGILTDFDRWSDVHRATLAYGYGLSVTPLQLARAYAAIANGGVLPPVTLNIDAPVERTETRVMSKETARRVRNMLESVVAPGGTGLRASVPGYRVAGKTGTVRKAAQGGYAEDRYTAVFAGLAPASSPRLVVVVTVDEPAGTEYYGGQVAAPVFAEVVGGALRLLGISPDDRSMRLRRVTLAARADWPAGSSARAVQ